ncbi:MAG: NAD(P)H-dependent oxidoreductase [Methanobacteriota archaeon]
MKIGVIYHSYSGVTRGIAQQIQQAVQGELIEVRPQSKYSSLTVVAKGCYRALRGVSDSVTPAEIDVSGYDLIVLASPVWAGRMTPVIHGAVDALSGCSGKKVFGIVTCKDSKSGDQAINGMKTWIERKGMTLVGTCVLDTKGVNDEGSLPRLIEEIRSTGRTL